MTKVWKTYIGKDRWTFSDRIYEKLTKAIVSSDFSPSIEASVICLPEIIPNKKTYGVFWGTPTFKDIDCNYLFHVFDKANLELVISTSSGNTAEGVARAIKSYNQQKGKTVKAILLVPEISSAKVSREAIHGNPYVKYLVLKNSTLDETKEFALKLKTALSRKLRVSMATDDLKTSAYAQIGLVLEDAGLMNSDTCYVQTVSGGVGAAGIIESAYELKREPELMIVQPENGTPGPLVDALNAHLCKVDPFQVLRKGNYRTSELEPTLASTKPTHALGKLIGWREAGGRVHTSSVKSDYLFQHKETIMNMLVELGIYPDKRVGSKYFMLEKSGFIAVAGALHDAKKTNVSNIVINFSGRRPDPQSLMTADFVSASPAFYFDPAVQEVDEIAEKVMR
jgi:hypothetical protein